MTLPLIRTHTTALATLLVLLALPSVASTQPRPERRPAGESTIVRVTPADAESTRSDLMAILQKHPPSVGRVLKLDPSLMRNEAFLESYPSLRDFLAAHPEIPQNAPYYLERIHGVGDPRPRDRHMDVVEAVLAGIAGFTAFSIVVGTLVWIIRTTLEQRRWNRLSKIQAEVHTKLMDRFSSNDELLAYVQTPSGRRFLESGPSPLQETTPAMAAPLSRILWSVQLGAILLVVGVGLLFLSMRAIAEAREFFYVLGCLATALGTGFLISAAAAYALSRRLGLLDRTVRTNA